VSARARILRKNAGEFLATADDEDVAVLLESIADELTVRGELGAPALRSVAWLLLGFEVGRAGNLPAIYSGNCAPETFRAKL